MTVPDSQIPRRSSPRRDSDSDSRLVRLEAKVKQATEKEQAQATSPAHADSSYRMGNRVLAELLGGLFGGLLIGWLLDMWLGTAPWLMIAMLFIGGGVALWNIVRLSTRAETPTETSDQTPTPTRATDHTKAPGSKENR